ncbi:hypothetical protein WJX82_011273 [Trebouxia sp. C0006]
MPDPEAESSRYVAVCRLPRNQCIECAYDTGNPEDAVLRSRKLQVQIWGQLQHTGHTPGTKESEEHLPIDKRLAAKADKWLHQHSPAEVEIMLERKQLQGMTCPEHRSRIFLRELQNIVRQHKQERWTHPEAWPEFMAKLELLSASEGQGLPAAFCLIYTPDEPYAMQAAVTVFIQQLC